MQPLSFLENEQYNGSGGTVHFGLQNLSLETHHTFYIIYSLQVQ